MLQSLLVQIDGWSLIDSEPGTFRCALSSRVDNTVVFQTEWQPVAFVSFDGFTVRTARIVERSPAFAVCSFGNLASSVLFGCRRDKCEISTTGAMISKFVADLVGFELFGLPDHRNLPTRVIAPDTHRRRDPVFVGTCYVTLGGKNCIVDEAESDIKAELGFQVAGATKIGFVFDCCNRPIPVLWVAMYLSNLFLSISPPPFEKSRLNSLIDYCCLAFRVQIEVLKGGGYSPELPRSDSCFNRFLWYRGVFNPHPFLELLPAGYKNCVQDTSSGCLHPTPELPGDDSIPCCFQMRTQGYLEPKL